MEFLSKPKKLNDCFKQLCQKYNRFEWVVAWAGDNKSFDSGRLLEKYRNKIEYLVVGLHFYQTHPKFIQSFMSNPSVRFIKQTDGIFHPKLYLFYNNNKDWAVIVGSSNFTSSGFNNNVEADICITSDDSPREFFKQIKGFIEEQWKKADSFSLKELKDYNDCWEKQRRLTQSLSKPTKSEKFNLKVFDLKTWDEYESEIINNKDYESRRNLLVSAHKLFQNSFATLSTIDRKRLSGCPTVKENQLSDNPKESIDWKFFGSTNASFLFPTLIKENNIHIANAIDNIPLEGKITKQMYESYVNEFLKSMPNAKNPLAVVTRLLCIKRPDVFICVDGKNKKTLCKQYGLKKNQLNIFTYWDSLIVRIMSSAWYDAPKTDLYPYRVAMLDCLHYEE